MPTVDIKRALLLERLGKDDTFSERHFADLCFDFGIELDEVTSEFKQIYHEKQSALTDKQRLSFGTKLKSNSLSGKDKKTLCKLIPELKTANQDDLYKIDVPANRYDLLCVEGLTRALRIFEGVEKQPMYTVLNNDDEKDTITLTVKKANCDKIRPFAVAAILRDVDLDSDARYDSLIKLQEKLHFNICRKRELVAIGTHDLDTLSPPFTYDALPPEDIKFRALKEAEARTAQELFAWYKSKDYRDAKGNDICAVKEYLPLIEQSPVFPVITDSKGVVLSLPPIINGEHSAMSRKTRNIFIECTATDLTKAKIVLDTIVAMFSEYAAKPFTVEAVRVVYEGSDTVYATPNFTPHVFSTSVEYINRNLGTELNAEKIVDELYKMGLNCTIDDGSEGTLSVTAPPTRSDILHAVDIVEDVAIAFGYNNLTFRLPSSATTGKEFVLNTVSDAIRGVVCEAGFTEVLNWALVSRQESFEYMLIDEAEKAPKTVRLSHPKAAQFEMVRTNLLPGMFKTLSANIGQRGVVLPLRLFEVGDVCFVAKNVRQYDVGARNERRMAAIMVNRQQSGLEYIHGLLDRVMEMNELVFLPRKEIEQRFGGKWPMGDRDRYYSLEESDRPSFFPGRQAAILVDGQKVGYFGIVHPQVLRNFSISTVTPCIVSALEINIECFVKRNK